jgi:hypothetical protein
MMVGELQKFRSLPAVLCAGLTCLMLAQEAAHIGVHVAYSLRSTDLTLGKPVILTITIVNHSGQPVRADLGQDRKENFAFKVIQPDQQELALPAFSREGISRPGVVDVDPGQSFSEDLVLNEWYQFSTPGKYTLKAILKEPITNADGRTIFEDHGSELRFTVHPRNLTELRYVCARSVDDIAKAQSYSEAAEAATQLSYVSDPAAVPYLKKGLELGKSVEPILISGLERIGDESAVQVLISSLLSGPSDTRLLARSALQHIYGSTQDSNVRKQIEEAFAKSGPPPEK